MEEKGDRRIRRTKRMLRQALAALMHEKAFKDITVTDLVERADINRGTFYVHYRDVYDLRDKIENEMVDTFRDIIAKNAPTSKDSPLREIVMQAADYLEENHDIAGSLMSDQRTSSLEFKIMSVVEEYRLQLMRSDTPRERYCARFVSSGAIAVIKQWLTAGDLPKEELAGLLDELLRPLVAPRA